MAQLGKHILEIKQFSVLGYKFTVT
jgi:hypothetical protein